MAFPPSLLPPSLSLSLSPPVSREGIQEQLSDHAKRMLLHPEISYNLQHLISPPPSALVLQPMGISGRIVAGLE